LLVIASFSLKSATLFRRATADNGAQLSPNADFVFDRRELRRLPRTVMASTQVYEIHAMSVSAVKLPESSHERRSVFSRNCSIASRLPAPVGCIDPPADAAGQFQRIRGGS
jgi:hypothetical protein